MTEPKWPPVLSASSLLPPHQHPPPIPFLGKGGEDAARVCRSLLEMRWSRVGERPSDMHRGWRWGRAGWSAWSRREEVSRHRSPQAGGRSKGNQMGRTQAEGWRNTKGKQERERETRQGRHIREGRINNSNEDKQTEVRSYKKDGEILER